MYRRVKGKNIYEYHFPVIKRDKNKSNSYRVLMLVMLIYKYYLIVFLIESYHLLKKI